MKIQLFKVLVHPNNMWLDLYIFIMIDFIVKCVMCCLYML